jgi:hypothetical protein
VEAVNRGTTRKVEMYNLGHHGSHGLGGDQGRVMKRMMKTNHLVGIHPLILNLQVNQKWFLVDSQ